MKMRSRARHGRATHHVRLSGIKKIEISFRELMYLGRFLGVKYEATGVATLHCGSEIHHSCIMPVTMKRSRKITGKRVYGSFRRFASRILVSKLHEKAKPSIN